jgi:hypothetical protein
MDGLRTWIDELPDVIIEEIKARKLKLNQVSVLAGFPHENYLSKIHARQKKLNLVELAKLAHVLQLSEEELIVRAKKNIKCN